MSDDTTRKTFLSSGAQPSRLFGRRGSRAAAALEIVEKRAFGKQPTGNRDKLVTLKLALLRAVAADLADLQTLLGDTEMWLEDEGEPYIALGRNARVSVDDNNGHFLFHLTQDDLLTLTTSRAEVLVSQVLCHFATSFLHADIRAMLLGRLLVGHSLAALEQTLILATLNHCRGNRTHAARMLGISLRTIRNKLRQYNMGLSPEDWRDEPEPPKDKGR